MVHGRSGKGALAVALVLALVGCTAPTPYQPATDGFGYAEQQLETNRYRISFAGNADTPRDVVQNYLLFRAAELTLENGNDYFQLVEQNVERKTRYYGTVNTGFRHDPFYGRGGFYDFGFESGTMHPVDSYTAFADVVMFQGEKPEGEVNAYDARDVIARLRPALVLAPA